PSIYPIHGSWADRVASVHSPAIRIPARSLLLELRRCQRRGRGGGGRPRTFLPSLDRLRLGWIGDPVAAALVRKSSTDATSSVSWCPRGDSNTRHAVQESLRGHRHSNAFVRLRWQIAADLGRKRLQAIAAAAAAG